MESHVGTQMPGQSPAVPASPAEELNMGGRKSSQVTHPWHAKEPRLAEEGCFWESVALMAFNAPHLSMFMTVHPPLHVNLDRAGDLL